MTAPTALNKVSFRFDREKLLHALAYMADKDVPDLTKLKAAKLLFFADKYHLLHYGRPVIGDCYVCMEHGPVPSRSLDVMNRLVAPDEIQDPLREEFGEYLKVDRFLRKHPLLRSKRPPDLSIFSESDIEALDHAISGYGRLSIGALVDAAHEDATWKCAEERRREGSTVEMPWESFFEGASEGALEVLRLIESEQEDSDALDRLATGNREARAIIAR